MTDNRGVIAGRYDGGVDQTCILWEGAGTIVTTSYDQLGKKQTTVSHAAGLQEGDWVGPYANAACTFVASGGIPVVARPVNGEYVIGKIVGTPEWVHFPTAAGEIDTIGNTLTYKSYRIARVKMYFIGIHKAVARSNSTDHGAIVPGELAKLKFNVAGALAAHSFYLDTAASGGTNAMALHAVADHVDGDYSDMLVGVYGPILGITGA